MNSFYLCGCYVVVKLMIFLMILYVVSQAQCYLSQYGLIHLNVILFVFVITFQYHIDRILCNNLFLSFNFSQVTQTHTNTSLLYPLRNSQWYYCDQTLLNCQVFICGYFFHYDFIYYLDALP